uniref:RNase H type-1 domain-containing protein n=1 Tax=Chenopodium quinoa TaxID=63459 RepID=A0A803M9Q6_CHEQI
MYEALQHLLKKSAPHTAFGLIINDILQLASECHLCLFSFVKRSGNCVAHEIAKLALSFGELRVWLEEVPAGISQFVMADLASSFE